MLQLEGLFRDVRFALRQIARAPGYAAVVILTLAGGVGAATAVFSVVDAVLLRALPYASPGRLVAIDGLGYKGEFVHLRDHAETMDVAGYSREAPVTWTGGSEPVRLNAARATPELFAVLGVPPLLGRTITPDDAAEGAAPVILLSQSAWRQRFSADPDIVGRQMQVDGVSRTIAGVMPAGFRFPGRQVDLWTPLSIREADRIDLWAQGLSMVARLRDGVTVDQTRAELRSRVPAIRAMFPWRMPGDYGADADVVPLLAHTVRGARQALLALFGAVLAVLAIACVNVASLMLTRGLARQREMAIRAAIGARPGRLFRQALIESLTLAAFAGAFGLMFAWAGVRAARAWLPAGVPRVDDIALDLRVFGFAVAAALLTGAIAGFWPALRVAAARVEPVLRETARAAGGSPGQRRTARLLVVAQIALAAVLVTSAGLLGRTVRNLVSVDLGFRAERLVTATVAPPEFRYGDAAARRAFVGTLLDRLRALPGVSLASAATATPLGAAAAGAVFSIEGRPDPATTGDWPLAHIMASADVDYVRTLGIAVVEGRGFTGDDRSAAEPVAVISQSLASEYWPDGSPLGARIRLPGGAPWLRVVGIVGDVRWNDLTETGARTLYLPMSQGRIGEVALAVRTAGEPEAIVREVRQVVASVDADTPVSDIRTADALVREASEGPRFTAALLGVFALGSLLLAALGVYGVLAHAVSQRAQEFGVRRALGAQGRDLFGHVLRQGLSVGVTGIVIGLGLSWSATRWLASLLFGVSPTDPVVFAGVGATLLAAAVAASLLPAWRASRADPMAALRGE